VAIGRIYALGGRDEEGNPIATGEAYDATHDTWAEIAPMSVGRHQLAGGFVATA
jgi:hypothetical protein